MELDFSKNLAVHKRRGRGYLPHHCIGSDRAHQLGKRERGIQQIDQKSLPGMVNVIYIRFLVAGDDPRLGLLIKLGALHVPTGRR